MKFKNCLLASDVDGTIMDQGYINPRNFEKIDEFVSDGGTFCISTGRCPAAMRHIVSQFENLQNVIFYNGGMIYDYVNKKTLVNKIINDCDKSFFMELATKFPEIGIEVYSGDEVYMIRESDACRVHFEYERVPFKYATFDEVIDMPWNKIMTFYEGEYDETALLKDIDNCKSETCCFAKAGAFIDGVYYRGVELLPKGTDKGQGLLELARILGFTKENTFAIGDYYNDFEMLSVAGISSCPDESPSDIKDIVDFVAGACRDGAVADFIEYLQNKAN